MDTSDDKVMVERREAMLWLTINRADKANAMTVNMVRRLSAAITAAAADESVRAVLLTGAGERVFSAGLDVREPPPDGDAAAQKERRSHAFAALQDAVMTVPKPVVVVLNGTASGGGAMLSLMADACVSVEGAGISMPEIDLGIATFSGANILEIAGGRALALDLVQSGRRMGAAEALARGLVRAVVPRDGLAHAAAELAQKLASKDAKAFADNKRWINRGLREAIAEARQEHSKHRAGAAR